MKIPPNMTEEEVLVIMDRVANRLANKFRFGYHEFNDMKQQAKIFAMESIDAYDGIRPLENFLWTCVHNQLFNFKRNKYERPDKPCHNCPLNAYIPPDGCSAFNSRLDCEPFKSWYIRNSAKKNIMKPMDFDMVNIEDEKNMRVVSRDSLENQEILDLLDINMTVELRHDWLKMKSGVKVPKNRRTKVYDKIFEILKSHGIEYE